LIDASCAHFIFDECRLINDVHFLLFETKFDDARSDAHLLLDIKIEFCTNLLVFWDEEFLAKGLLQPAASIVSIQRL
jgi:hypothetical protein